MFTPAFASMWPNLAASPGWSAHLTSRALSELDPGSFQGGAHRGFVAGGEHDGAVVAGHHPGQLQVDVALGADITQVGKLARLVLELDAEQVHGDLPSGGHTYASDATPVPRQRKGRERRLIQPSRAAPTVARGGSSRSTLSRAPGSSR